MLDNFVVLSVEFTRDKKPAYNGRFCEMAAVTPQTILCELGS